MVVGGATAVTTAASMRPGRTLCCCCETHNAQRSARSPDPQARGSRNRSGRTLSRVLINTTRPLQEGRYPAMDGGAPAVKHNAHNLRTPSTGAAIAWPCCQFGRSAAKMRGRRLRFLNRCGQTELCRRRSQVRSPLEYSTLTLCARAGGCGQSHDEGIDLNLLKLLSFVGL